MQQAHSVAVQLYACLHTLFGPLNPWLFLVPIRYFNYCIGEAAVPEDGVGARGVPGHLCGAQQRR